jgi:hypothetical protein
MPVAKGSGFSLSGAAIYLAASSGFLSAISPNIEKIVKPFETPPSR